MIADSDTRDGELYAPADEVLPCEPSAGGGARDLEGRQRPVGKEEAVTRASFAGSRERFEAIMEWLDGKGAVGLEHAELESRLESEGRELLRALLQDHLDLRARRERRQESVANTAGVAHGAVEADHRRALASVFGEVTVSRLAYRARGEQNLYVADGLLNLEAPWMIVGDSGAGLAA